MYSAQCVDWNVSSCIILSLLITAMSYPLCDQIVGFVLEYVFNLNYLNDHSAISTPADTVIITGNTGYL